MTGSYYGDCEGKFEGRENVDNVSASSGTKIDRATEGSIFAGEPSEVGTEQDRGKRARCGELHLTACDWRQYLERKN